MERRSYFDRYQREGGRKTAMSGRFDARRRVSLSRVYTVARAHTGFSMAYFHFLNGRMTLLKDTHTPTPPATKGSILSSLSLFCVCLTCDTSSEAREEKRKKTRRESDHRIAHTEREVSTVSRPFGSRKVIVTWSFALSREVGAKLHFANITFKALFSARPPPESLTLVRACVKCIIARACSNQVFIRVSERNDV